MKFEQKAIEVLGPIFAVYAFFVAEIYENYVRFESGGIAIRTSCNDLERSNSLSITIEESSTILINEKIIKSIFNSDLKVDKVGSEIFLENFKFFFENKGRPILEKDLTVLEAMQTFRAKFDREYHMKMVLSQKEEAADKAWANHDYKEFINIIDKEGMKSFPRSFELKYKIAKKNSHD